MTHFERSVLGSTIIHSVILGVAGFLFIHPRIPIKKEPSTIWIRVEGNPHAHASQKTSLTEHLTQPQLSAQHSNEPSQKTPSPLISPPSTASPQTGSSAPTVQAHGPSDHSNTGSSGPSHPLGQYLSGLRQLLEDRKVYPSLSRRMGETGSVLVSLEILRNGTIREVKLKSNSPFARLDQAALQTVASVDRYKPIPDSVPGERLKIDIPIEFTL